MRKENVAWSVRNRRERRKHRLTSQQNLKLTVLQFAANVGASLVPAESPELDHIQCFLRSCYVVELEHPRADLVARRFRRVAGRVVRTRYDGDVVLLLVGGVGDDSLKHLVEVPGVEGVNGIRIEGAAGFDVTLLAGSAHRGAVQFHELPIILAFTCMAFVAKSEERTLLENTQHESKDHKFAATARFLSFANNRTHPVPPSTRRANPCSCTPS